ncbi:helix-turn-helix domain-containing protein [Verrucomicrobiaceae bacterium N1E253]|uniref:Helix-turn-helix domain-containing protein n=1 Tax=Oceaniferula marina TaxID=2748318 RepID=A0A851GJJ6_9BACT|nr:helix-turn-helix domain-containing protein [Oceaniferula marina]NWK55345.1 helix-turn-helix domain-containing protein [Oceaniferula marina]
MNTEENKTTRKNVAILLEKDYERPFRLIHGLLSHPGVQERCAFRNFTLFEARHEDIFSEDWKPDGMIVCYDEKKELWLKDLDIPVVNLIGSDDGHHPSVGTDYRLSSKAAVEHFDTLNYKNLLFVETMGIDPALRMDQYLGPMCEERHIKFSVTTMPDALTTKDIGQLGEICPDLDKAIEETLKNDSTLGIYTRHDLRGRLIVDYLTRKGIDIPGTVGVLGCFDCVDAKLCDPPLSSVMLRDMEIGARGIAKLERLMAGEAAEPKHEKIPPRGVRVRGSTLGQSKGEMEILRARSIIRDRAKDGITVDMLVDELNISRSTFEKYFIALTGHSPAQEIRQVRTDWARELLLTTDLPMTQLAPLIGFKDRRAFIVFFKREAGMTPAAFRKMNKR